MTKTINIDRDAESVIEQCLLEFEIQRERNQNTPEKEIVSDVVTVVCEPYEHSLPQAAYYTERFVQAGDIPQTYTTNILEDMNEDDLVTIIATALEKVAQGHLHTTYDILEEDSTYNLIPGSSVPMFTPATLAREFNHLVDDCIDIPLNEITRLDGPASRENIIDTTTKQFQSQSKDWSLTKHALFTEYILSERAPINQNRVTDFTVSKTQIKHNTEVFNDIFKQISHGAIESVVKAITLYRSDRW